MDERRPPRWNLVSICTPLVGFLCAVVATTAAVKWLGYERGVIFDELPILVLTAFGVFGLIAAGVALFRTERLWGLTALGIVVNAPALYILCIIQWHNVWHNIFGI